MYIQTFNNYAGNRCFTACTTSTYADYKRLLSLSFSIIPRWTSMRKDSTISYAKNWFRQPPSRRNGSDLEYVFHTTNLQTTKD
ncbi:unnamed protein product [Schistosoma mattheei]|uniref:Uncharacterized protein n=1 Tax=Schistosoma mattheei TaxID=31246 RepID=A0A3P7Y7F2_9TREM|nr:unnamed protein product [Schistosoma mattheei]